MWDRAFPQTHDYNIPAIIRFYGEFSESTGMQCRVQKVGLGLLDNTQQIGETQMYIDISAYISQSHKNSSFAIAFHCIAIRFNYVVIVRAAPFHSYLQHKNSTILTGSNHWCLHSMAQIRSKLVQRAPQVVSIVRLT